MDSATNCPREALTIAEAARRLNVSPAFVYRLARRGKLPGAARIGRAWRIDPRRLEELFGAGVDVS